MPDIQSLLQDEAAKVSNLPSFQTAIASFTKEDGNQKTFHQLPGIRHALFEEGLFLAKKGLNAVASSKKLAASGHATFSIPIAYYATFLLAKSVLAFCGIGFVESSQPWIVDVFPGVRKLTKSERNSGTKSDHTVNLSSVRARNFEHRGIWVMFLRVLAKTNFTQLKFANEFLSELSDLDAQDFAALRNRIAYSSFEWLRHDDIVDPRRCGLPQFGSFNRKRTKDRLLEPDDDGFAFDVATVLSTLVAAQLRSLSGVSNRVDAEIAVILNSINAPHHLVPRPTLSHQFLVS